MRQTARRPRAVPPAASHPWWHRPPGHPAAPCLPRACRMPPLIRKSRPRFPHPKRSCPSPPSRASPLRLLPPQNLPAHSLHFQKPRPSFLLLLQSLRAGSPHLRKPRPNRPLRLRALCLWLLLFRDFRQLPRPPQLLQVHFLHFRTSHPSFLPPLQGLQAGSLHFPKHRPKRSPRMPLPIPPHPQMPPQERPFPQPCPSRAHRPLPPPPEAPPP